MSEMNNATPDSSASKTDSAGRMALLSDLRVFELKQELEKRGLDKNGIKVALVERLESALRDEGHDPTEFLFSIGDYSKGSTPTKVVPQSQPQSQAITSTPITAVDVTTTTTISICRNDSNNKNHENDQNQSKIKSSPHQQTQKERQDEEEQNNLLIDDTEKPMIELDDEDGKNDVDTEDEREMDEGNEEEIMITQDSEMNSEAEKMMRSGVVGDAEGKMEVDSESFKAESKADEEMKSTNTGNMDEEKNDGGDDNDNDNDKRMDRIVRKGDEEERINKSDRGKGDDSNKKGYGMEQNDEDKKSTTAATTTTTTTVTAQQSSSLSSKAHIVSSAKTASTIKKTSNSLWIKGLGSETKAADLKTLFVRCGRVVTAKIFTRRQQPSSTCFGFVTMIDTSAAEECIRLFNKTHINGHLVTVERADHSSMPAVKSGTQKKVTTTATTSNSAPSSKSKESIKTADEKSSEKRKSDKAERSSDRKQNEDMKAARSSSTSSRTVPSKTKRVPITAPSKSSSEKTRSAAEVSSSKAVSSSSHRNRSPPVFRKGRRVFERPLIHHRAPIRGAMSSRKPTRISLSSRPPYRGSFSSRGARGTTRILMSTRGRPLVSSVNSRYDPHHNTHHRGVYHGRGSGFNRSSLLVPSRSSNNRSSFYDPSGTGASSLSGSYRGGELSRHHSAQDSSSSWDRREMMNLMRRREEEFRLKEEELKLQRERERIKFERERIERERLELEQLRQVTAMSTNMNVASGGTNTGNSSSLLHVQSSRHSRTNNYDVDDMDMSSGRRGDSRVGNDRTSTRHISSSSSSMYGARGDTRRDSSRDDDLRSRVHSHRGGTAERERERERERDRSRHVMRDAYDYGSSSVRGYDHRHRADSFGRRNESSRGTVSSYGHGQYTKSMNASRANDVDDRSMMSDSQWTTNDGSGREQVMGGNANLTAGPFTDMMYNTDTNASYSSPHNASSLLHRNDNITNDWMITQSSNPNQLLHNASNSAMSATNSYTPNEWRSSQYHSGAEWPSSSSGGYGSSHSTTAHSSYGKPYEKPYSKYDSYSTNKYSSRRY